MSTTTGRSDPLFDPYRKKIVNDYQVLKQIVKGLQAAGHRVVITIGSFDALHIGHVRYLLRAKAQGDVLIVGIDSDRAMKLYKDPNRPIIPEYERLEMLSYQSPVDWVTIIDDVNEAGQWQYGLIETIRPDVFVAVEDSYPESQRIAIRKHCGELVVLRRQAEDTSSTNIYHRMITMLPQLKDPE